MSGLAADAAGGAVERQLAGDMIRRALPVAPVLVALGAVFWGAGGALSSAFAIGLVLANFAASAALLAWAAPISPNVLMATALAGFLGRLSLIAGAVFLVKDQSWVEMVPLGATLMVTHLGLLFWETRYVSASLAFPGLKPLKPTSKGA